MPGRAPDPAPPPGPGRSWLGPFLRFTLLAALVAGGFALLRWGPVADQLRPEALAETVRRFAGEPWAPFALAAAYLVLTPIGVPASPLMLVGGLAFGFAGGTALNFLSLWASAAVAYLLGRVLGKDLVERLLGDRLRRIEDMMDRRGFWPLVRLRFVPIPFLFTNYAAALAGVRPGPFLATTALGLLPAVAVFTYFGVALFHAAAEPDRAAAVTLQLAGALAALFLLTFLVPRLIARSAGRGRGMPPQDEP